MKSENLFGLLGVPIGSLLFGTTIHGLAILNGKVNPELWGISAVIFMFGIGILLMYNTKMNTKSKSKANSEDQQ